MKRSEPLLARPPMLTVTGLSEVERGHQVLERLLPGEITVDVVWQTVHPLILGARVPDPPLAAEAVRELELSGESKSRPFGDGAELHRA